MLKIIVTGPESSGKTTLCIALSIHYNLPFTKEFAREYLTDLGKNYLQEDLLEIAKGQLENEQLITNNQQISLHDTDLITLKIWSDYKYGNCNNWILEQIEKQKVENRFYLLCKPDLKWDYDPLRENPTNRNELLEIYKQELENLGHKFLIIKGEDRNEQAIESLATNF
ncbi:ATP-binding protein [Flavobacteriales bacterium]|nr:ATP-binding protein [Flavobacteriales bacterium]MDA9612398.1 ATP-binding protein [Flavobacteriales bacterium]